MTRVYLIRHAEAEGNLYRRCHGWYDSLITENGYRQIAALEARFRDIPIDAVYSSDLFRTMATAGAVYKPRGLALHVDPALREIGCGVWEDRPWGRLRREEPDSLELFNVGHPGWQVEGSETFGQVQERVAAAVLRLAAAHDGESIAVFSHGTAIRTALAKFSGCALEELHRIPHGDNTCVACLDIANGQADIRFYNDNSHLGELSTLAKQSWWKENGVENYGKRNIWYRPMELDTEGGLYLDARAEAWRTIHGSLRGFDGEAFLAEARRHQRTGRGCTRCAMLEDRLAGILQLDFLQDAQYDAGSIPFYYLTPESRSRGLGVQLLGEAVSILRPQGRSYIRLRCARDNKTAQRFYLRHGFVRADEEPGSHGPLDVLEKYIGYEEQP